MNELWPWMIDFAWVSLFFMIATMIKSRIRFFQNFIIPTSIIAGFIGLFLGPELLGISGFDKERLESLVYHLMAIGFIAISLKEREKKKSKTFYTSGLFIVSTYLIQGVVGFGITLFLAKWIYPNLFPPLGLLLPLGYGQGPGQASSIGTQWEDFGLVEGGNLGLTIATLGFLWATIIGVIILNFLIKRGMTRLDGKQVNDGRVLIKEEMSPDEIPLSDAHDKLSFQLAVIGGIYLITYLTISVSSNYLNTLGTFGQTFSHLIWGFHFLIGSLYAILFRIIFDKLKNKGSAFYNVPNNYLLQRIAGSSFDYMITASIAAISFHALKDYIVPLLLISTIGGIATVFHTYYLSKWMYSKYKIENFLGFYGMGTGTISTGMALLRVADPKFETNVTENMVMGSAVAIGFGAPLMLILNIPIVAYVSNQPFYYILTLLLLIGYLGLILLLIYLNVRSKTKRISIESTISEGV